jgi:glycosyltransferase involved in cell wall biosynthesis
MVEFLAEVYPALKQGSVRFSISVWGARPSRRLVRALQAAPEVRHVGYVDDYVAFLKSATIYVLPQRYGAGIQTKVQQAMALGIPVVTRPAVLEALGAIDGEHGFGCQTNEQMTIRLRELLEDGLLRQRVGEVGRQLMRKSYGVEQIGRQLENAYCAAISKHRNAQVGQIVRAN